MSSAQILISEQTLQKIKDYYQFLSANGIDEAGAYLRAQLESSGIALKDMDLNTFATLMVQSKIPKVFAESAVYHDKRDWTLQEESILGDVSIDVPVTVYNDGGHYSSFKPQDHSAHLAYVAGALLRSDLTNNTADMEEVIVDGELDQDRFNNLYERRLLPQLIQINAQALSEGKLAAVTFPGIGTGQFAGEKFAPVIKNAFREALEHVLEKHQDKLQYIDIVHYDPHGGDVNQTKKIDHIDFRVRPSSVEVTTGQLAYPEGSSPETHTLTSFVAWDQFSWPGNDFWLGDRRTDDGVKAASTDTMAVITGVQGTYNPKNGSYEPPKEYKNWQQLAKSKQVQFTAPIYVVSNDGQKIHLKDKVVPVEQHKNKIEENISDKEASITVPSPYDLGGGNRVFGIEQKDTMFIVHAKNTAGDDRTINVHADGSITGYDGKKPDGPVATFMATQVKEIFQHFNVPYPELEDKPSHEADTQFELSKEQAQELVHDDEASLSSSYDLGGGNRVLGIEQKDTMFIVHAKNTAGDDRTINVHADGSITGYDGKKPEGPVATFMATQAKEIFQHFKVPYPEPEDKTLHDTKSTVIESPVATQPGLSKEQAQQLLQDYETSLKALDDTIQTNPKNLLRSDAQMVPFILDALRAIANDQEFNPELATSGMSSIKSLAKDPEDALIDLLDKGTSFGNHFAEMIDHYFKDKLELRTALHVFQNQVMGNFKASEIELTSDDKRTKKTKSDQELLSDNLDSILNSYALKIKSIGAHHPEANAKAQELLINLREAKEKAFEHPNVKSLKDFSNTAEQYIREATPILQKDLGWGDYLSNMAAQIVNAVTTCIAQIVTLGNSKHQGFFSIKQSEANKEAQELNKDIKDSFKLK